MQRKASTTYKWCFAVNETRGSWRLRVGWWMRRVADLLDGRSTLAVRMETTPYLSRSEKNRCLLRGLNTSRESLEEEAKAAAMEINFKSLYPKLFENS